MKVKIEKSFLTNPIYILISTADMFWKTVVICVCKYICTDTVTDTRQNPLMVSQSKTQRKDSKPFVHFYNTYTSSGTISWHKQKIWKIGGCYNQSQIFRCFSCEDTVLQVLVSSVRLFVHYQVETRLGIPQCQAQGLVFCSWLGLMQDRINACKINPLTPGVHKCIQGDNKWLTKTLTLYWNQFMQ